MNAYRKSSYIITVNLDNLENEHILVHGYTGTIDIISDDVMKFLNSSCSIEEENLPFSTGTFELLKKRGYITKMSEIEEQAYVAKIANVLHGNSRNKHNFVFALTYDCNFRCPYCFERGSLDEKRQQSKDVFTKEMVDKAYEVIKTMSVNGNSNKEIKLYGGEPLMSQNKDIVSYIVKKGNDLGFHFYAITNGYDLNSFSDIIKQGMIERLQITIDGTKEYHDNRRIHFMYQKSFDKIIDNIKNLLDKNITIQIRINTDSTRWRN